MSQPPGYPSSGYPGPDPRYPQRPGQYGAEPGYPQSPQAPPPGYPQPPGQPYGGYPDPGYPGPPSYQGYPPQVTPPPPKKSKAGKIVLIILAAIVLLCGGGGAIAYFALKDDVKDVVTASQTRLVAPETLAGRPKITDADLQRAADSMVTAMKSNVPRATSTIAAFYGNPAQRDLVMIAGASALISDPAKDLDDALDGMSSGGLKLTNIKAVEPGPLGGVAKCADGTASEQPVGVCAWADRGSLCMIIIYFKSAAQASAEFVKIRGEVEQRT